MNTRICVASGFMALATAISAVSLSGCAQKQEKQSLLSQTDSIDLKKPNLPLIGADYIQYRGLDGKVVQVKNSQETAALYKAIAKMSVDSEPDILESEDFYVEVQKNIHSAENYENVDNRKLTDKILEKTRISEYFDKIFKMYTACESEDGTVITVREYTKMMDAFSKTGG